MTGIGALMLGALAGLNPWVVLVIVVGLAAYTRHAPLNPEFAGAGTTTGVVVLGAVLGIEVVVSKVRRAARLIEPVSATAAAVAGALLPLALVPPGGGIDPAWLVVPGLGAALGARALRARAARRLDGWLTPYGHVAASMGSDLIAGCLTAAVFAIKP